MGDDIEDRDDWEDSEEIGDGLVELCGKVGDPVVLRDFVDVADLDEQASDVGDGGDDLLSDRVIVDEALLKNALAGDMVTDGVCGSRAFGDPDDGRPGRLTSLGKTIKDMCNRFLASLFET
jgi:hypothetical protein